MAIQELITSGTSNTILMLTPAMLQEFAAVLIAEASEKLQAKEEPTYTPAEFAERHRVDKSTLWRWNRDGLLKKTVIGGKIFYKDSDLKRKEG